MQNLVGKYLVIVFAMMTTMINGIREVGIGVILDMDSNVGKSCRVSILMALEEFYGSPYNNFTTIIHPHFHDSKSSNFDAASLGLCTPIFTKNLKCYVLFNFCQYM